MKNFEEYSEILNTPIHENETLPILNETEIVALLGGRTNYNILKESGYPINEGIFDLVDFFGGMSGEVFSKRFVVELIAGLISPLAKKLNLEKGSILWYMLLYGTQEAFYELGSQLIDPKKKTNFCHAFAVGIVKSSEKWAVGKVMNKIVNKMMGMAGYKFEKAEFLQTTFGVSIANTFTDIMGTVFKEDIILKYLTQLICDESFVDVDGKKQSLFDAVTGMGDDVIKGILKHAV